MTENQANIENQANTDEANGPARPAFALAFGDGGPTLTVVGEMDMDWQDVLRGQLAAAAGAIPSGGTLTVNLCCVPFLDSSCIYALTEAWKHLTGGARMRLVLKPDSQPSRTMRITNLYRHFEIVECPEQGRE